MKKITLEQNKTGYCKIIASIIYYEHKIGNEFTAKEIDSMITNDFWRKEGFMSSNMNRPKMVYDLCDMYHIPNNGYDDIHKYFRELFRPDKEVQSVYTELYNK